MLQKSIQVMFFSTVLAIGLVGIIAFCASAVIMVMVGLEWLTW